MTPPALLNLPLADVSDVLLHPAEALRRLLDTLTPWVAAHTTELATGGVAALFGYFTLHELLARRRHAQWVRDARQITVQPPPEVDPAGAVAFWSHLGGLARPTWRRWLFGQPHVVFEYAWRDQQLRISVWVPGRVPPGLVEHAVRAAWPGASVTVDDPAAPLPAQAAAMGGTLRLARREHLPLHHDHDTEPLRPLLGAAGGLDQGEQAAVQILARPRAGRRLGRIYKQAATLNTGHSTNPLSLVLDLVWPAPAASDSKARSEYRATHPETTTLLKAVLDKATASPHWEVAIRYGATVPHGSAPRRQRGRLRGLAHALASAFAVYRSGHNHLTRHTLPAPAGTLTARRLSRGDLLSAAELAALAHLPADVGVPGLVRAGATPVTPSPQIPHPGPGVKPLGEAAAGPRRTVGVPVTDARQHLHVLGATGSGKSTLLSHLVCDDIADGRGTVLIDPKGDLVTEVLDRMPAEAGERTVLIDPDSPTPPPALNPLAGPDAALAIDHLVGICRAIFAPHWGPRTDDVLRAACLTLHRLGSPVTLEEIPRVLLDDHARRDARDACRDDPVLAGFWGWYEGLTDAARAQVIGSVLNKLRAFLMRDFVRDLTCRDSTWDMANILRGGVCLARLPKGLLGDATSQLIGSFLIAQVWQAATHRARTGQHHRRDASIYLDEAHNFLHLPYGIGDMLAEARGYRLSLTLAHQDLAQLPKDMREGMSANAHTKIVFNISPEDARALEQHVAPELTAHDLAHLDAYHAAARVTVAGRHVPAFTLRTLPPAEPIDGRADEIRAASAARYAHGTSTGATAAPRVGREAGPVAFPTLSNPNPQETPGSGSDIAISDSLGGDS